MNRTLMIAGLLAATLSPAAAADIAVFSTGAPSVVLKELSVPFARDTGNRVTFTVATPGELQKKLAAGETPDLVVMRRPSSNGCRRQACCKPAAGSIWPESGSVSRCGPARRSRTSRRLTR